MKYKVWTALVDGGDGKHHQFRYKSEEELRSDLNLDEYDMDVFGYFVQVGQEIFDMEGYEIVS